MAIITPSSLISEIRGSVGTQTFSRNKYRPYVKVRKAPLNTASAYKTTARGYLTSACAAWKALTDEERFEFIIYAKEHNSRHRLSEDRPLSGYNFFIRFYIMNSFCGVTVPTEPGVIKEFPQWSTIIERYFQLNLSFDCQATFTRTGLYAIISASKDVNASKMSINSVTINFIKVHSVPSTLSVMDYTTAWENRYGTTIGLVGRKVFTRVRLYDSTCGQLSAARTFSGIIGT